MFATSLALIANAFHGKDRGSRSACSARSPASPAPSGPCWEGITSWLSWRWIFFVNIPIGAVAITLTLLRVRESRNPDAERPDWLGFITFSSALGLLVYGLIGRAPTHGDRAGSRDP